MILGIIITVLYIISLIFDFGNEYDIILITGVAIAVYWLLFIKMYY